jgi:hypothetical protein
MEGRCIGRACRERILGPKTWSKEFRARQPRRPENRATQWIVRLGLATRSKEPRQITRFGRKTPPFQKIVPPKGTGNAAPLRRLFLPDAEWLTANDELRTANREPPTPATGISRLALLLVGVLYPEPWRRRLT